MSRILSNPGPIVVWLQLMEVLGLLLEVEAYASLRGGGPSVVTPKILDSCGRQIKLP